MASDLLVTADGQINLLEIAKLIKEKRPEIAQKVSTKKLPDFILSLGAKFNHQAKEGKLLLDMNRNVSNERAKNTSWLGTDYDTRRSNFRRGN